MSDLYNDFPSWGEAGEYPQNGFFYDGGDQVNEKHMDALWNGVKEHIDNLNTAIRNRVRDLHGNVVLDQGLVASTGSDTREVDVTASNDGAYVSGQYTGSISAQSTSHTANSGSSTRTDTVYLEQDGSVSKSEGTSSAPADTLIIAEVDVATDDTISDVRNYARDHAQHVASEQRPSGAEPGDIWHDLDNSLLQARVAGAYHNVAVENNTGLDFEFEGGITVNDDITAKDDETINFGSEPDFSLGYDSSDGSLQVVDEVNSTDLVHFNPNGPVEVQNGGLDLKQGDISNVGSLSVADKFSPPVVATEAGLPDATTVPEGTEITVLSDPNNEVSVYKVVDQ